MDKSVTADDYSAAIIKYQKWTGVIRMGFAPDDDSDFVALKLWLQENFRPEFVELF